MVLKRSTITSRLQELDTILQELGQYRHIAESAFQICQRNIGLVGAAKLT